MHAYSFSLSFLIYIRTLGWKIRLNEKIGKQEEIDGPYLENDQKMQKKKGGKFTILVIIFTP